MVKKRTLFLLIFLSVWSESCLSMEVQGDIIIINSWGKRKREESRGHEAKKSESIVREPDLKKFKGGSKKESEDEKLDLEDVEGVFKAAVQGNPSAQYFLAGRFSVGEGVEQDPATAIIWYTKSAKGGDPDAQYILGEFYRDGESVEMNLAKASYWFAQSAKQGDREAQFALGAMYYNGKGVPKDYQKALNWFTQSAAQGYSYAQKVLVAINEDVGSEENGSPTVGYSPPDK